MTWRVFRSWMLPSVVLMALLAMPARSHGDAVIWDSHPDGPRTYLLVQATLPVPVDPAQQSDWDFARDAAAAMELPGAPGTFGYLATITSAAEQQFIESNVLVPESNDDPRRHVWLGGWEPNDDGNWEWITGEAWSFTNWDVGEPNDLTSGEGASEDYLTVYQDDAARFGYWNDALLSTALSNRHHSYIVEFNGVPEPASLMLLLAGVALASGLRRCRS